MNKYQKLSREETTGWDATTNDVNGVNSFNLVPIQVAMQVGNVEEIKAIIEHPEFDPKLATNMGIHFAVCKNENPARYEAAVKTFKDKFVLDSEYRHWREKTPEDIEKQNFTLAQKIEMHRAPDVQPTPQKPVYR